MSAKHVTASELALNCVNQGSAPFKSSHYFLRSSSSIIDGLKHVSDLRFYGRARTFKIPRQLEIEEE